MIYSAQLNQILLQSEDDQRMKAQHKRLFRELVRLWKEAEYEPLFAFQPRKMLHTGKFRTIKSVERCLSDLSRWGYVHYFHSSGIPRQGFVQVVLPFALSIPPESAAKVVMPQVLARQAALSPLLNGGGIQTVGVKLAQIMIQALIQLVIAWLNRHFDLL